MKLLVVVAVEAERAACPSGPDVDLDVVVGGVGPARSAASTAAALTTSRYDAVLSAGIGGGFLPADVGDLVVADEVVFADLGVETADGRFRPVSDLGIGEERMPVDPVLRDVIAQLTGARIGTVLTVATVTGTAATAAARHARHPTAVAEAMEGVGVAAAAARIGTPFGELRAISNLVGPRDRSSWRVGEALQRLGQALQLVAQADWKP